MKKLILIFLLDMMVSCHPDRTSKDDLAKFTNRIEQNSTSWNEAYWDDTLQKYDEIC